MPPRIACGAPDTAVPHLQFGDCLLDIDRRELRRQATPIAVEPQVFDLLVYLITHRERVVGKDELFDVVWPGRIVTDATLTSRINAARRAIGDDGAAQRLIRTYARKGFRFVAEVREAVPATPTSGTVPAPTHPDSGPPSIAVLPFVNLSSDAEQEYFSDGITEDLITALTRHRSLVVIARNSSFAHGRRENQDVRRLGRELGAAYLVQGSVRRAGARVRITAQLVETETARQVWAEQYDCALEQIFEVQDEITATITARVEPEVGRAEEARLCQRPPQAFGGWEFFRLGTRHFYRANAEDNREAERLFRRVIEIDPTHAAAYGFIAYAIVLSMVYFEAEPDAARLEEAESLARRGVGLDERDASVRFMHGRVLLARGDYSGALAEMQSALELNPNLAVVHCGLGDALAYGGRAQEAIPSFARAVALSPHDPLRWAFWSYGALAQLFAHDFTAAEAWAYQATRVPNCHYWGFAHRVAALGFLDARAVDRAAACAELAAQRPGFTGRVARRQLFYLRDPRQLELYVEGLRRAGIPDD